jgi:hypothetical protein
MGHQLGKVLNYEDLILDIEVQEAVLKELSKHGNSIQDFFFCLHPNVCLVHLLTQNLF